MYYAKQVEKQDNGNVTATAYGLLTQKEMDSWISKWDNRQQITLVEAKRIMHISADADVTINDYGIVIPATN